MSVATLDAKRLLVLSGLCALLIAAILWYRIWVPAEAQPEVHNAESTAIQTVTLIKPLMDEDVPRQSLEGSSDAGARGSATAGAALSESSFDWRIPGWLPPPPVPEDNPMSEAKVSLGRHLFYDQRLSQDDSMACDSCHQQSLGFTDGRALSVGVGGSVTERSAMGLANVGYSPALTWANPHMTSLERQALVPMFSEEPVEMGMAGQEQILFGKLQQDPLYKALFAEAFPEHDGRIDLLTITRALAAFERTLVSVGSPYDKYKYGNELQALGEAALRGETLFYSEKTECYHCHQGFNFTDTLQTANSGFAEVAFYNTGLYNLDGQGLYPAGNKGLFTFTNKPEDMGKFRTQSLRNVGVTAPYFHDGSAATLDEVIDHYAAGGRRVQGALAGNGHENPHKDPLVMGFELSDAEREDLKAFLHSLTDAEFLSNPRFSDPWPDGHPARGGTGISLDQSDSTTTTEVSKP